MQLHVHIIFDIFRLLFCPRGFWLVQVKFSCNVAYKLSPNSNLMMRLPCVLMCMYASNTSSLLYCSVTHVQYVL